MLFSCNPQIMTFLLTFQLNFIVMQSIFWPSRRIRDKYDLKGCLKGRNERQGGNRKTSCSKEENKAGNSNSLDAEHVVLKDANFVGE